MRVAVFSTQPFDREFLSTANQRHGHDLQFIEARLTPQTCALAGGVPGPPSASWERAQLAPRLSKSCSASATRHLINAPAIARMPRGVMIINTGRGALVDTRALIEGLKSEHIGYVGLDVYEEEEGLFFRDLSSTVIHDDVFARLLTFPNVVATGHQAFFTREALHSIAETTLQNVNAFERGGRSGNELF